MAKLDDWRVLEFGGERFLSGVVSGHPKLPNDEPIITSRLLMLNPETKTAQTYNTQHELGEPKQEWLDWLREKNHDLREFNFDMRN